MTERRNNKYEQETRKLTINARQNINRLYDIISALYAEIQGLKRHTGYKLPEGELNKFPQMNQDTFNPKSVNVEEDNGDIQWNTPPMKSNNYGPQPGMQNRGGMRQMNVNPPRRTKIIDN